MFIALEGTLSQWAPVTPGVPQGSPLGPLIFITFMNLILSTTLYADKSKICAVKGVFDFEAVQTTKTLSFQY